MRYFKFGCTLLGMLIFFNCNKNRSEAVQLITATEMKEISEIEGIQLVDVRTPDEYKEGHLPNALNIDFWMKILKSISSSWTNPNLLLYIVSVGVAVQNVPHN